MKKIILLLTSLLLSAATSFAQTVATGTTGDCTWTLTGPEDNYTLTISGSGAMADYSYSSIAPWYSYRSSITQVIVGDGVTRIGDVAFSYCSSLTDATIGNSVTSIGNDAFYRCSGLTSVTIPNSVESIGNYAFSLCTGLTEVTIGNSVESIGNAAFYHCTSLTEVTIPNSVKSIGISAFYDCTGLTEVTIGSSVKSIGISAFYRCSGLTSVTIPNSVENIGDGAFSNCTSLTDIIVENGSAYYSSDNGVLFNLDKTTLIQYPAGKSDVSYVIPNSVTSIGYDAFSDCTGLTSVTIPNSVISIGVYAFYGCTSLASVTIGNSVESIGAYAFYDCESLTEVTNLNPTPQSIESNVFQYVDLSKLALYVPAGSIAAYEAALVWRNFGTIAAYVPAAIDTPAGENDLWVYPNPVRDSFQIKGLAAPALAVVTDLGGKIVWKQTVTGSESIPASHWPAGVYLLRAQGQTLKVVKRLSH